MTEWKRTGKTEWRQIGVLNVSFVEWLDPERGETIMLPNLVHPDNRRAKEYAKLYTTIAPEA